MLYIHYQSLTNCCLEGTLGLLLVSLSVSRSDELVFSTWMHAEARRLELPDQAVVGGVVTDGMAIQQI